MRYAWIHEPPFGHIVGGRVTGCDVDLAQAIFSRLGERFEPVETEFSELLPGLRDGRWEVTAGMFITPERAAAASFTTPIWRLGDGLLIRAGDAGKITGYGSIAKGGLRLAVLKRQIQHETALAAGIDPRHIVILQSYEEAADAVMRGDADAYASVARAHHQYIASSGVKMTCIDIPATQRHAEPGAFACRSTDIRDRIDAILKPYVKTTDYRAMMTDAGLAASELA